QIRGSARKSASKSDRGTGVRSAEFNAICRVAGHPCGVRQGVTSAQDRAHTSLEYSRGPRNSFVSQLRIRTQSIGEKHDHFSIQGSWQFGEDREFDFLIGEPIRKT